MQLVKLMKPKMTNSCKLADILLCWAQADISEHGSPFHWLGLGVSIFLNIVF